MSNKTGTLKHGLKVGDQVHKEFEIREATSGDLFAAENEVPREKQISFAAALLAQQLVRVGTFTGPFNLALLGKLKVADLNCMHEVRLAIDEEGEAEQPG